MARADSSAHSVPARAIPVGEDLVAERKEQLRAAARKRRRGSMRALARRDELRAQRLAADRVDLEARGRSADHLRDAAATTRDFARRNSSRADPLADPGSIEFRLIQAEEALLKAGYTLGQDGTWNPPAGDRAWLGVTT
jgi:hypothetical protein